MTHAPLRSGVTLAALIVCGLAGFGSTDAQAAHAAATPATAIKADAHHLAADVKRGAHEVGHQVAGDAHDLHHRLVGTRTRVSLQLHQLGHRIQRWWRRVSS